MRTVDSSSPAEDSILAPPWLGPEGALCLTTFHKLHILAISLELLVVFRADCDRQVLGPTTVLPASMRRLAIATNFPFLGPRPCSRIMSPNSHFCVKGFEKGLSC